MNCYAGLAKRIVKSCFPQVVPVPQLEPLDASKIIKQEVKDNSTNKVCFALSDAEERVFKPKHKPLTDEEAWEATLAWAETKAQEREAAALKAASQTNTDESYDSDDSEVGVQTQPVRKSALFGDNDEFDKKRVSFGVISVVEVKKFMKEDYVDDWSKDGMHLVWEGRSAATIIQAVARGRAARRQIALIFVNIIDESDRMLANLWGLHPMRLCIIEMQCTHAGKYYVQAFFRWRSQKLAKTPLVGYKWDTNEKKRHNVWVADVMVGVNIKATAARVVAEKRAAIIIQAAARGMSGRRNVWDAAFDKVAAERAARKALLKATRKAKALSKAARKARNAALDPTTWYHV